MLEEAEVVGVRAAGDWEKRAAQKLALRLETRHVALEGTQRSTSDTQMRAVVSSNTAAINRRVEKRPAAEVIVERNA